MSIASTRFARVNPLDNHAERFTADASGNITDQPLQIRVPQDQILEIYRIVIRGPITSTFTDFTLYANSSEHANTREYINVGPANVAVESYPVIFTANEQPIAVWRGLTASVTATVILTGWFVRRYTLGVQANDEEPLWRDRMDAMAGCDDDD